MKQMLLIFASCLFIFACTPVKEEQPLSSIEIANYTPDYKTPVFEQSDRIALVKAIGPQIHQLIEQHASEMNIPGVSYGIVMNNQLIVSGATGIIDIEAESAASTSTVFRIASMTKSFTAMAILKLRDEGKLSLDDFAQDYIPEMEKLVYLTSDAPPIRINNLLTMTSGFPEDNPWGDRQLAETDKMLMDLMNSGAAFSTVSAYQYEYSNTGYALLGHIISKVTGMSYQQYITSNILTPLGMLNTYWEYDDVPKDKLVLGYRWEEDQWKSEPLLHDGSYGSMGGLITTIEDFSKYVNFHLQAWPARTGEETGPVRRSTLREMHNPQFARLNDTATDFNNEPCPALVGYGYGLRITKTCEGLTQIGHGGALPGYGSNYVFYPDYDLGIMAFGNLTYTGPYPLQKIEQLLFDSLGLQPRKLPISDILSIRQQQVANMIQFWDPELEEAIIAENFYMDFSRERRMSEIKSVLEQAGEVNTMHSVENYNNLRGRFTMEAKNGQINVYFTLSPEADPKVQQLYVWFSEVDE